ncbi:hypothetical protein [Nannocystis pusilla]|uniref:hypothetical protein n=1 Tax=Nannocystis pusilla TaxID=889268 RepID=UPI003B808E35
MTRRPVPVALLAVVLVSCSDAPSYAAFVAYDNAHMSAGTGSDAVPVTGEGSTGAETGPEADADTATSEATSTGGRATPRAARSATPSWCRRGSSRSTCRRRYTWPAPSP